MTDETKAPTPDEMREWASRNAPGSEVDGTTGWAVMRIDRILAIADRLEALELRVGGLMNKVAHWQQKALVAIGESNDLRRALATTPHGTPTAGDGGSACITDPQSHYDAKQARVDTEHWARARHWAYLERWLGNAEFKAAIHAYDSEMEDLRSADATDHAPMPSHLWQSEDK